MRSWPSFPLAQDEVEVEVQVPVVVAEVEVEGEHDEVNNKEVVVPALRFVLGTRFCFCAFLAHFIFFCFLIRTGI